MNNLANLAYQLNTHKTESGIGFYAELSDSEDLLTVVCDSDPESPVFLVQSEEQILTVSQLFSKDDVLDGQREKLNETLLNLSPVVPLSSIGLQGNDYILFGAMSINTTFENLVHELFVQVDNVSDVLDSLSTYLNVTADDVEEL